MMVAQQFEYIKYHLIVHFKMTNFILCKSHLKKNGESLESQTSHHLRYYN